MALSPQELNLLIQKLRSKYADYAQKHSAAWFNIAPFEERLAMAQKNRMDIEAFVLAEIANFEKLKTKYDAKKNQKSFSDKVDKIIEEQLARIKKYPPQNFHPKAHIEMVYAYGALRDFAEYTFPILWNILRTSELRSQLPLFEQAFQLVALPRAARPAPFIEDHVMLLSRAAVTELDIEKDKNRYLKECAFLLHDIVAFCDRIVETRDEKFAQLLTFDKLFLEGTKKRELIARFDGYTSYGAILKVRESAASIIDDFRLGAFKRAV